MTIRNSLTFLFVAIFLMILSCKKDTEIISAKNSKNSNLLQDTIHLDHINNYNEYELDFNNDSKSDLKFTFSHNQSPGGGNSVFYKVITLNPLFNIHSTIEKDTMCEDITTGSDGKTIYHYQNCSNTLNFYRVDSSEFVPIVEESAFSVSNWNFNYHDTIQIYRANKSWMLMGSPGYISETMHGAFLNKSEGYFIVKTDKNQIKGVKVKYVSDDEIVFVEIKDIN